MKILKPTLTKVILSIIILFSAYYYNTNHFFVRVNCERGHEEICQKNVQIENRQIALEMTLITGLPIAIIVYVLIGVIQTRKKKDSV